MDKDEINRMIGKRINKARKEAHLTRMELAKLVGVSDQTIYLYEKQGRGITVAMLFQLAEVFGCSADDLLMGKENAKLVPLGILNLEGLPAGTLMISDTVMKRNSICIYMETEAADGLIQPYDLCLVDTDTSEIMETRGRSIVAVKMNGEETMRLLFLSVIDSQRAMFYDGQKTYICQDGVSKDGGFSLLGRVYKIIRDM